MGFKEGDIITSFDGGTTYTKASFKRQVESTMNGIANGASLDITVAYDRKNPTVFIPTVDHYTCRIHIARDASGNFSAIRQSERMLTL